jgi:hypothetical protein
MEFHDWVDLCKVVMIRPWRTDWRIVIRSSVAINGQQLHFPTRGANSCSWIGRFDEG